MARQGAADETLKIVIIGDSGVGKSCILQRFTEGRFVEDLSNTIGVEFGMKVCDINGRRVKLQVWDTAGQERYRSVTRCYYRGAAGCLLVYDVTSADSFRSVPKWLRDTRTLAGEDIVVMLLGNKADLGRTQGRQVEKSEGLQLAEQHGLMFFETSAATGEFVEEAFHKVAQTALLRKPTSAIDTSGPSLVRQDSKPDQAARPKKKACSC